ncbi:type II secretion system protein GspL [Undibacterium sp.]|jgi:general secretion pathway protein L|uniref:type II secretion system protein GspL n=1 Tax=Undibacterium sp. TaxID=1914977 RepID=UPI002C21A1C3|nr:type II secretion system protein GspL [Undibacterium sp.]HTD02351.1 type II secretion system protein GspL [Undibacterium sp.]
MLSTLYILLPSKTVAYAQTDWTSLACPFALISNDGMVQQHGEQPLSQLKDQIGKVRQVAMLLAASDVTVIQIKAPPLSAAKLKTALPNLVEDQLASDPASAVLVSTPVHDGFCTVAATDKKWIEALSAAIYGLGAKKVAAYASQLCFEWQPGASSVFVNAEQGAIEFALRSGESEGFGLTLRPDTEEQAVAEVLQALKLFAPEGALALYAPAQQQSVYQQACEQDAALAQRITVKAASWNARVAAMAAPGKSSLDLMAGVSLPNMGQLDLSAWRWPLVLGGLALLVNIVGLNTEWLSMKREAKALNDSLTQSFRASYPKETVLRPLDQMQQKISLSRKQAGQSTPDDFLVLASQFAQVWDRVLANAATASVVSLEYREHSLFVKTKSQSMLPIDQIRAALADQSLALVSSADGVLQIKPVTANAGGAGNVANRSER